MEKWEMYFWLLYLIEEFLCLQCLASLIIMGSAFIEHSCHHHLIGGACDAALDEIVCRLCTC